MPRGLRSLEVMQRSYACENLISCSPSSVSEKKGILMSYKKDGERKKICSLCEEAINWQQPQGSLLFGRIYVIGETA